jgi:hypothetical protein
VPGLHVTVTLDNQRGDVALSAGDCLLCRVQVAFHFRARVDRRQRVELASDL